MLQRPHLPTALVYTSDSLALAGLGVAHERGLAVPDDISIAGFDDSPLASLSFPPLTTVRVDYVDLGRAATEALLAEIENAPRPEFTPAAPS